MQNMLFLTVLLLGVSIGSQAQNFSEWWRQRKTRLKYLAQQAVALETLEKTEEEGYERAEQDVGKIRDTVATDLQQHARYLEELQVVSPAIRDEQDLRIWAVMQENLIRQINYFQKEFQDNYWLDADERVEVLRTCETYLTDNRALCTRIKALLTDGNCILSDGERVTEIRSCMHSATHLRLTLLHMEEVMQLIIRNRRREAGEDTLLKLLP